MDRKYNLKLDLQFRCNNQTMKFNQFDNNTSDFFMRITNAGKLVDIEKAIVVLAVIKPSGKVSSQFVEVKNDVIYADLKNSMKDEIGTYTAQAMLILEDERVVTDPINYEVEEDKIFSLLNDTVEYTEEYSLLTDMLNRLSTIELSEEQRQINEAERILSEENRKIEEVKRVEAELIRQHEEADRAKYDAIRESNENIRKQNESIRLSNETNRIDEEAKRAEAEALRVQAEQLRKDNYNFMTEDEERRRSEANTHKEAENLRVQAETNRVNEEAKRRTTEQARVSAENTRVSNENTREANEVTRQSNETQRVEAETQRQNRYNSFITDAEANANNFENYTNTAKVKEEERKSNELDRKTQEDRRISNEVERISNENTRKANEEAREKNETSRQNIFENKVDEFDEKIVELNTTKENFISSINTKVDNKISEIDNAKSDMTNTVSNKIDEVENRFNALTSSQQQDAEVIDARDGETSLKARLDRDIEKAKQVYVNVEGSNISTDSSVGYAKDIEIHGNTIQDASNLADIRSVGDEVEGQELYKIGVVSCGKNLIDYAKFNTHTVGNGTVQILKDANSIKINGNGYYASARIKLNLKKGEYIVSKDCVVTLGGTTTGRCFIYINNTHTYTLVNTKQSQKISLASDSEVMIDLIGSWEEQTTFDATFNVQLEEGTVATPYEPYQEDKLTILSPVQLEKVGDVADRIIEKDGVWGVEKNVVRYNFPYELNWASDSSLTNSNRYYIGFKDLIGATDIKPSDLNSLSPIICDKYTTKKVADLVNIDEEGIGISISALSIRINNNRLLTLDANGVNKLIAKEGLMILYQTTQPQFIPLPHDQQIKLRTFANKTNISFLTEIEGTIKAQVPKSLGATVNTHTEQISNLNKELDRVKKLEESTVSTVTTESDFTTVEATSNGYFEDVKLEGKTLVNLAPFKDKTNSSNLTEWIYDISNTTQLQNGKEYTFVFDLEVVQSADDLNCVLMEFQSSDGQTLCSIHDGGIKFNGLNSKRFIAKMTIPQNVYKLLVLWKRRGSATSMSIKNLTILEGDHTQNPPNGYIEGLKSVGQSASEDGADEIVVSSVKGDGNLFDFTQYTSNGNVKVDYVDDNKIIIQGISGWYAGVSADFKVKPNTRYLLKTSGKSLANNSLVACAVNDVKTNTVIHVDFDATDVTKEITTISDSIRITLKCNNETNTGRVEYNNIMLVEQGNSIEYTPHQSDKKRLLYYNEETQSWEKPILREWDSIEKHADGKYYYHVRSVEEDYTEGDETVSDYMTDMTTTVKPLAQEKVYECTNIDLITYANETNYVVESGVIVPKTTLKVHNNISNVVSLLQKKVSLLENNITSYMITQNRLMLASRYNADTVSFKVDVATLRNSFEYDNDLYELILNNILVGKDNYNRDYIENLIIFYWMDFVISDEMYITLFEIIEEQHNPKVIEEEAPIE